MVVHLLLLVRDVDCNEISVLDVAHFDLLLLECVPCLVLAVVESTIDFLAATFDFLAYTIISALGLAEFGVLAVSFLLEFCCVVAVKFTKLFGPGRKRLQRISEL